MDAGNSAFDGQVALVTGAASGIGRECARLLAQRGASVVYADRDHEAAEREARGCADRGLQAIGCAGDVAVASEADAMVHAAIDWRGQLDIVIHSAGIGIERPFLETSDEDWKRLIDVDLTGTFYVLRSAAKLMVAARYGRIVTLASTAGLRGGTGRAAYGAAKGGVITLTKVLAVEVAQFGVTANALAPGAIETELVAKMHSAATRVNYRRGIPMDRYGLPSEVAEAAAFLASREASYISGAVLPVDGGFLAAGVMTR